MIVDPGLRPAARARPRGEPRRRRADDELDADCDLPAARPGRHASRASRPATGVTDDDADAVECFGSGDDVFSLIQITDGRSTTSTAPDQRITVLGAWSVLANDTIARDGNAALALNLLGEHEHARLVPARASTTSTAPAPGRPKPRPRAGSPRRSRCSCSRASPRRSGAAAGSVRSSIENLPVTVRASETMLGRARLYERSGSRLRALDALRIGTVAASARTHADSRGTRRSTRSSSRSPRSAAASRATCARCCSIANPRPTPSSCSSPTTCSPSSATSPRDEAGA